MNYGGFWIRFLAYLVDSLIVGIAFFAIVALLGVMGLELISNELILFVMGLLYYAFMQSSARQATFGKALVGLKVGGLAGERISLGRALAREAAKILSFLTFFLGFIIAAFTKRKQALHDLMATTCVVRAERGHVVAALAVGVVALLAPFVVVFMFGAGLIAGMVGGLAGGLLSGPEVAMQAPKPAAPAPKPAAPAAPPVAKPQAVQTPAPAAPAPAAPALAAPAPAAPPKPTLAVVAQSAEPPKPAPAAKPVVLTQAQEEAPKPAAMPKEPAKPVAAPAEPAKPMAAQPPKEEKEKPKPLAAAPVAQERLKPVLVPARPMAAPSPRFNDLATAVLYSDAYAVEQLLAFGKWPDKPDSRGLTALMLAAQLGDIASAEALLKAGASPNRSGPGGDTAMSIARERKDSAMLQLLQRYGGR